MCLSVRTLSQWRKVPNKHCDKPTIIGATPTYDRKEICDINGVTTINARGYDNQWWVIDGVSMTNGAASTISQLVNRGASDVPEQKFNAARQETHGLPYQSANDMQQNNKNQRKNGFLQ